MSLTDPIFGPLSNLLQLSQSIKSNQSLLSIISRGNARNTWLGIEKLEIRPKIIEPFLFLSGESITHAFKNAL